MSDLVQRLEDAFDDRYRIERVLGEGGFATVFLAEDLRHPRHVAIKVLNPEVAATLERRTETSPWTTLASLVPDGNGSIRYVDRAVAPGMRYGYRVRTADAISEERWVAVPAPTGLALAPIAPSPADTRWTVRFTVPEPRLTLIETWDVSGRRVVERELGVMPPGPHEIVLDDPARLAPGVYMIRLRAGRECRTSRALVAR
jgi:hypothetical protein